MRKVNISIVDSVFASGIYPIEMLFFYSEGVSSRQIRAAVRTLASAFWPLFGTYDSGVIEYDGNSEGDCFQEEIRDEYFDTTRSYADMYQEFRGINPSPMDRLSHITVIQYRNGTAVIPKVNHLAGDGYSYFYYLSSLAAVCRGLSIPLRKYLIRTFVRPSHQRNVQGDFLFNISDLKPAEKPSAITVETERIPKDELSETIRAVRSDLNERVSANDVLSAMFIQKLAGMPGSGLGDTFKLTIPIDVRRHIREFGPKYFGNGLMFNVTDIRGDEVKSGGIEALAICIRRSMPKDIRRDFQEFTLYLEECMNQKRVENLRPFDPNKGCLVTNLTRMPTHRLNFGTGDPAFIFPLTVERNAAAVFSVGEDYVLRYAWGKGSG